jgi:uncharacterized membrane protein
VPAAALALALAAALLHAVWNVLLARTRDVEAATAVAVGLGVLFFAPFAAASWQVEWSAVPYIAASSVFQLAYFVLLAAAYRRAELSLVYPLARGLAPVFVLVVAVAALGAGTSAAQVVGVLLVAVGVVLVRGLRGGDRVGVLLGLAVASTIAGYTLVDNGGIEHADAVAYLELALIGPAIVYLAFVGRERARRALSPAVAGVALASFGAYVLVLAALDLAPAAPVAAVRETSVVIATALAAVVLRERVSAVRAAGAVLVAAGVVALGLTSP